MPAFGVVTAQTSFGMSSSAGSATTLSRSDHVHGTPVHDAGAHASVPLNSFAAPTGNVNFGGFGITNLASPVNPNDGANKTYVDNAVAGLSWKQPCRVASTANVNIATGGLIAVDGVTVVAGDRVLLKNQTTAGQNGIYVAAAGAWLRSTDANTSAGLTQATCYVESGTTQADTAWTQTTDPPITVDTTALTWVQFSGGGTYQAGNGLTLTGNVFAVGAGSGILVSAGQTSVDTSVVTPTSRLINTTAPLTGGGNLTADRTLAITNFAGSAPGAVPTSPGGTATYLRADGAWASPPGSGMTKYSGALAGTASPEVVTHNLNTRDVMVNVLNGASPYTAVVVDWDATTVNTITIRYNPNLGAGYRVVVIG
jgi:hypothetical protein